MTGIQLKILLFLSLIFVGIFWNLTTPKPFGKFVLSLYKIHNWPVLFFQVLPFVQLVGLLNLSWHYDYLKQVFVISGLVIMYSGIIFACWAKLSMKNNWGRPGQHNIGEQKNLVIEGPYRFSRNPIYVGLFLLFAGFELAIQSWFIFFTVPLFILINFMVAREEKLLENISE